MKTLDVNEAAALLGIHKSTLQGRAKAGIIPGAKVGRAWRFVEIDLIEYMRAQYSVDLIQRQPCQSTSTVKRGGFVSITKADALEKALGLPTRKKPSASTTSGKQSSGQNPSTMGAHGTMQ